MKKVQVPFTEINIAHDEEAVALVERINNGRRSVPTIVFPDGSALTEPSNAELMAKLSEAGLLQ
jgi:mycoredoxin